MIKKARIKICLISSSGGHYEQLKMLKKLGDDYDIFWVTEATKYASDSDYYLIQTGMKDKFWIIKMLRNSLKSFRIWIKEKPEIVITTGTMIALPMCFVAKLLRKKLIYIETFSRVYNGTRAGKMMYKFADLFIIQWEPLKKTYPNAIYGGSIY